MTLTGAPTADEDAAPSNPQPDTSVVERTADPTEVLFPEARRRERKRRLLAVGVLGIALGGAAIGYTQSGSSSPIPASLTAATSAAAVSVDAQAMDGHGDLAFVSLGALYVLADGHLRRVVGSEAAAGSPTYSPNGRFLSYRLGNGTVGEALADGSDPHTVPSISTIDAQGAPDGLEGWLPGGDLLVGTRRYSITSTGLPERESDAPPDLVAFSSTSDRYVFLVTATRPAAGTSPGGSANWSGTERIEVSSSLFGPRTIWRSTPIRLDHNGVHGDFASGIVVLPDKAGILLWTDPDDSDNADGSELYELRRPGGSLTPLAITVGNSVTIGRDGKFSFSVGGPRVAWIGKSVETCDGFTARCAPVGTPQGTVTVTPAWSPDGSTLAYVEAASMPNWNFPQSVLNQWYSTHELLLKNGSNAPEVVKDSKGATTPVWSTDGKSLLFVANDALYLLPRIGSTPERVARPLLAPGAWGSYYGEINWAGNFSWSLAAN
jgi:hypothetical protein